jgi:hypothetical protein
MKAVADHPNRHICEAMHKFEFVLILAAALELTARAGYHGLHWTGEGIWRRDSSRKFWLT